MNKQDIAANLIATAATQGYTIKKSHAEALVGTVFTSVAAALVAKDRVAIPELGVFKAKEYPAGQRRNPQNGEMIQVPARTKAKFSESKFLKEAFVAGPAPVAPVAAPAA